MNIVHGAFYPDITFVGHDSQDGTALPNPLYGQFNVFFVIEKLPTGALQTTTVLKDGSAVHSRHTALSDNQLAPSQYYGKCQ